MSIHNSGIFCKYDKIMMTEVVGSDIFIKRQTVSEKMTLSYSTFINNQTGRDTSRLDSKFTTLADKLLFQNVNICKSVTIGAAI